ncbi:LamB/YcsF family protein (plasmid) [Rhizobium sp. NIBRBAC000502774]|nr:LamB/YcsF family protein [Rhizobium sp. NIBRBAC000502774]
MKFDVNSDLGEGFGQWTVADDNAILDYVTSANVACGFHAGDAVHMSRVAEKARARKIAIGAHIGLPDRMGFGRVPMMADKKTMRNLAIYQLGALDAIARAAGHQMTHANAHGAWSNGRGGDEEFPMVLVNAIRDFSRDLIVAANPASRFFSLARKTGIRMVGKVYADRAYEENGLLVKRSVPGSIINDLVVVEKRIREFAEDQTVQTLSGKRIKVDAQTILVHSDTPGSLDIIKTVVETLRNGGAQIAPLNELA